MNYLMVRFTLCPTVLPLKDFICVYCIWILSQAMLLKGALTGSVSSTSQTLTDGLGRHILGNQRYPQPSQTMTAALAQELTDALVQVYVAISQKTVQGQTRRKPIAFRKCACLYIEITLTTEPQCELTSGLTSHLWVNDWHSSDWNVSLILLAYLWTAFIMYYIVQEYWTSVIACWENLSSNSLDLVGVEPS